MNFNFNESVLTNAEYLKPFAITLTHDAEDAKDLCQETLYRAFANEEKYSTGTNIRAWLYTIMRNIFINNYRRRSKQKIIFKETTYENTADNYSFTAANEAVANIPAKEITAFIDSLPKIFQDPLLLYFHGYKYQEIAEALNEPLGTIKSRIHFARKLLKTQIQRQ